MHLLAIIIVLALDRYAFDTFYRRDFSWYRAFCQWYKQHVLCRWENTYGHLLVLTIPLAVIPTILSCLLPWRLLVFVFDLLILFYCLGSTHFNLLAPNTDDIQLTEVERRLFTFGNEGVVAVLCWFVLFGSSGAALMRLLLELSYFSEDENYCCNGMQKQILLCKQALCWFPARILSFSFVLAGHFMKGFPIWLRMAWSFPSKNNELLLVYR